MLVSDWSVTLPRPFQMWFSSNLTQILSSPSVFFSFSQSVLALSDLHKHIPHVVVRTFAQVCPRPVHDYLLRNVICETLEVEALCKSVHCSLGVAVPVDQMNFLKGASPVTGLQATSLWLVMSGLTSSFLPFEMPLEFDCSKSHTLTDTHIPLQAHQKLCTSL